MTQILNYAKAHVALVGGLATWATATFPPHTTGYRVAAGILAVLSALGVYATPNKKAGKR